jgi:hypothetical protein
MSQDESNKSEVARIRAQIAAESQAAWQAMHGPAIVAQHQIITARLERIGMLHEQLQEIDEGATQFLVDTLQASADTAKKDREVK